MNTLYRTPFLVGILVILTACGGGGAAPAGGGTSGGTTDGGTTGGNTTGPVVTGDAADLAAFSTNLHTSLVNHCGGCHATTAPAFAQSSEQASLIVIASSNNTLVNLSNSADSRLITKLANDDHFCGEAVGCSAKRTEFKTAIDAWADAIANPGTGDDIPAVTIQLTANQQAFADTVFPIIAEHCAGCHSENGITTINLARFAHSEPGIAHDVVTNRDFINMSKPDDSRLATRLLQDEHSCWSNSCSDDANTIIAAINEWKTLVGGNVTPPIEPPPIELPPVVLPPVVVGALSSVDAFASSVLPVVQQNCASCHNGASVLTGFANSVAQTSHDATLSRNLANLTSPKESLLVSYLQDREHNCWSECATNASQMEGVIAQWQQLVTTPPDGNNNKPVAVADNFQTPANTPLTTGIVLLNDNDPDNDTLVISAFDAVSTQAGQVQDNGNGTFTYTPAANFSGTDTFSYTISDSKGGTAKAVVTITVMPNNIAIAKDDLITSDANTAVNITTLLLNDIVPQGRTLNIVSINTISKFGGAVVLGLNNTVTYTPPNGFTGIDSFEYSISDGVTVSNALVRIDINAQPIATSDAVYTDIDVAMNTGNVLVNDIDTNNDVLTITTFDTASAQNGSVSNNGDGSFKYVPANQFEGSDSFQYTVSDGRGGSDTATVFIRVTQPVLTASGKYLALVNQTSPAVKSDADTARAYYRAIDPANQRTTLDEWRNVNGFNVSLDARTIYINDNDLGFSRRMHIRTDPVTGVVSSYVENYANLLDAQNQTNVLATVVMEHNVAPGQNPLDPDAHRYTSFYVFDGNNDRALGADLDGGGFKFVPGLCNSCHGGRTQALTNGVYPDNGDLNAGFIPWDLDTYLFADATATVSRSQQEAQFKILNQGVLNTKPLPVIQETVEGWYGGPGLPSNVFNGTYVPKGWLPPAAPASAAQVYSEVVAPYCRACHIMNGNSLQSDIDLNSYDKFMEYKSTIEHMVYDEATMPLAVRTWDRFWADDNAPKILANALSSAKLLDNNTVVTPGRPIAKAGQFREAALGRVDLNGNASLYAGGDSAFSWTLVDRPANSNAVLQNTDQADAFFTADEPGDYIARLVINDGVGGTPSSPPGEVVIRVSPLTRAISFITDISPIFEQCAGCHKGYDNPGFNNTRTLHETVIDFVNTNDTIASPILTKPSGNHHAGGTVSGFETISGESYRMVLRWIQEGALDN